MWRAESSDGLNWTWYISGPLNSNKTETLGGSFPRTIQSVWSSRSFMSTDGSVPGYGVFGLLKPILLSTGASTNNAEWWGFFNFWNGASRVGALRITWSGTPSQPTVRVLTGISPSWTYTSVPNGAIDNVTPVELYTANVKSLLPEGGGYQLWGGLSLGSYGQYVSCDTNTVVTCGYAGGCATGDGSTVAYGQSGRPFWLNTGPKGDVTCPTCSGSGFAWWPVTRFSFGGLNVVYSRVRNLPSGYEVARGFPFRWNSPGGQRYLFSATNDAHICTEFLFSPFWKMYVVRTQLTNEP